MRLGIGSAGLAVTLLLAGAGAAQPERAAIAAPKNVALVGVTETGDRVEAWLMDTHTRQRITVRPGETAFGFRVRKVGADNIVLADGKREFTVRMGDKEIPSPAAPARTVIPAAPGKVRVSETPARRRARTLSGTLTLPPVASTGTPVEEVPVPPEAAVGPSFPGTPDPAYPTDPYGVNPYGDYRIDPRLSPYYDEMGYPYPYPLYPVESALTPYAVSPYPGWGAENPLYPERTGLPRPYDRIAPWNTPAWNRAGDPRLPYATPAAPRNPQTGRRQGWTSNSGQNFGMRRGPAPNPQTLRRRGQLFRPDLAPSGTGYTPGYPR